VAAWHDGTWTYSRRFPTRQGSSHLQTSASEGAETLLVFDGIRMGATIKLNGHFLGNATDQFLRYQFAVQHFLAAGSTMNLLEVSFDSSIATGGRFTYSSQIDWAPVFTTTDPTASGEDAQKINGRETFGFGIWKSVYLVSVDPGAAAITQFAPHTFYSGGHPTSILSDSSHLGFEVRARVSFWAAAPTTGTVTVAVEGVAGASATAANVKVPAGHSNVTVTIPAAATKGVRLWHPHNHGGQPRYNITATFTPAGSAGLAAGSAAAATSFEPASRSLTVSRSESAPASATTWRLVGFRHVALVTINDTDTDAARKAANQDGTGQQGMFFRVNGAAVYARGGNKIPMDLIDGRTTASSHHRLVQTAADGNMNMLRVWGGGIWEPRAFFDACDELGVLVYLDMQFTWGSATVPGAVRAAGRTWFSRCLLNTFSSFLLGLPTLPNWLAHRAPLTRSKHHLLRHSDPIKAPPPSAL
jgi:beta-mannosidase